MKRIDGTDYGFSGAASIVEAAVAMNRLDLLDELYDHGTSNERLLLCIMASLQSMSPQGQF